MKHHSQKLLILLLVASFLLSLVGCGTPTQDPTADDPSAQETLAGENIPPADGVTDSNEIPTTDESVKASSAISSDPIEIVEVDIAPGKLIGYHYNGVYNFKGIPYATAERFQSPVPVTEYRNGTYAALTYGAVAPQDRTLSATGSVNFTEFANPSMVDMVGNETCQYLNVWSSDLNASNPVIVFLHGGSLTNGASSEVYSYTGEYMVKQEDVVFVSLNHRLNVLGYLDMSAYGEEFANSAIAGIEDCVVALQWVQDNISSFGGDPSNVTIIGQSGGAVKVSTLACMSDTVGLFDKVFMMSGRFSNVPKEVGLDNTKKLVDHLGLSQDKVAETLVNMDYEELLNAATAAGLSWSDTCYGNGTYETPLIDDNGNVNEYAAQRTWIIGTTFSEMSTNFIPMIKGQHESNYLPNITDEDAVSRLTDKYGDKTDAFIEAFKSAYPEKPLSEALYLDATTLSGARSRPDLMRNILPTLDAAGVTVYNYIATYTYPSFGGITMSHNGDIGYWFHSLDVAPYMVSGDEANAYALADTMASALTAFATTGDPSTDALEWKAFTAEEHNTMVFDVKSELKVDFDSAIFDVILED